MEKKPIRGMGETNIGGAENSTEADDKPNKTYSMFLLLQKKKRLLCILETVKYMFSTQNEQWTTGTSSSVLCTIFFSQINNQ